MKIRKATRLYEAWLSSRTDLVEADLALKHQRMAESQFSFMRATVLLGSEAQVDGLPSYR